MQRVQYEMQRVQYQMSAVCSACSVQQLQRKAHLILKFVPLLHYILDYRVQPRDVTLRDQRRDKADHRSDQIEHGANDSL
jgi:hypothetical protein